MNKINPLYILLLLAVVAVTVAYKQKQQHERLKSLNAQVASFEAEAEYISSLRERWGEENIRQRLESLLAQNLFKQQGMEIQRNSNSYVIRTENIEQKSATQIINKIVNMPVIIRRVELSQPKDENMSMRLELGV